MRKDAIPRPCPGEGRGRNALQPISQPIHPSPFLVKPSVGCAPCNTRSAALLDGRSSLCPPQGCNSLYAIDPNKMDCDYYDFLKTESPPFRGEYMSQYSRAEQTCGLLWQDQQAKV